MKRILINDVRSHINQVINIQGWIKKVRCHGNITFIIIRDRSEYIQTVYEGELPVKLNKESAISIRGKVVRESRAKGGVEVKIIPNGIEIVSEVIDQLPFEIEKVSKNINPQNIYNHRALGLRNNKLHSIFKIQSEILTSFRKFLNKEGFLEIATPKIVSSGTEGGTELFEIKYFEQKAYLAQSPQFYKQMMVGAGYERVFETGKAYRAEKHDTSRHINEYMSLDLEMGFIEDHKDIMNFENRLLGYIVDHLNHHNKKEFDVLGVENPDVPESIPVITFEKAVEIIQKKYKKEIYNNLDPDGERMIADWAQEKYNSDWLFIENFPLSKRPFYTMYYQENPEISKSFDLLYKGLEVTTGGQRIHLYHMLVDSLVNSGLDPEEYSSYLDIFQYGMPPHGGLAIGLERLTMQLCNLDNIREASLFPRDRSRLTP